MSYWDNIRPSLTSLFLPKIDFVSKTEGKKIHLTDLNVLFTGIYDPFVYFVRQNQEVVLDCQSGYLLQFFARINLKMRKAVMSHTLHEKSSFDENNRKNFKLLTFPVGLFGVFRTKIFVFAEIFDSTSSKSKQKSALDEGLSFRN